MSRGYGGSETLAQRFGGTAETAGNIADVFDRLAGSLPVEDVGIDFDAYAARPVDDLMDAVVEVVRPIDGTQDAEAERAAIREALADLYAQDPDVQLDQLTTDQRAFVIERYVASDIFRRVELDVGGAIRKNADTMKAYLSCLRQVKEFVRESVASAFRKLGERGQGLRDRDIASVVGSALRETFSVFESYVT